jgi:hypothetical protein
MLILKDWYEIYKKNYSIDNIYIGYAFYTWYRFINVLFFIIIDLGFPTCTINVDFNLKVVDVAFVNVDFCVIL